MGFLLGPTKTVPNPDYPNPDDPDDPSVPPTITDALYNQGSGSIGYFAPLKGRIGDGAVSIDLQVRSVNYGGTGLGGPDSQGVFRLWLYGEARYVDAQGVQQFVSYTYTRPTSATDPGTATQHPTTIPSDWSAVTPGQYGNFANEYTPEEVADDALLILQSLAWGQDYGNGQGGEAVGSSAGLSLYGDQISEIKYRFIYPVTGLAGSTAVRFRWRKRTSTLTPNTLTEPGRSNGSIAITYGGEQSETVALSSATPIATDDQGNPSGLPYACTAYHTVLYSDMQNGDTVTIIGPGDTSYLLSSLSVGNALVGFRADALQGGFSGYVQPQAAPGQTVPAAVYAAETATAAPGATADFSGGQSITSIPEPGLDAQGQPGPTSVYANTLSDPAQGYRSGPGNQQFGRTDHAGEITGLTPDKLSFANGLILTLSEPVSLDTVASDCATWLNSTLAALRHNSPAYNPSTVTLGTAAPLPPAPVWINGYLGSALASHNGPFGTDEVYLLGHCWTSADRSALAQALSVLTIAFTPMGFNGTSLDSGTPGASVYNKVDLTCTWDVVTQDLGTGQRSVAQGTGSYSFDGTPTPDPVRGQPLPPPVPPMVDGVFHPVPAPGTRVFIENFRLSPDTVDFIELGPAYEIVLAGADGQGG